MKPLTGLLLSALFANAAVAQPAPAQTATTVGPDTFTADPLFQRYIGDQYQMTDALQANLVKIMEASIPPEVKVAAPALPGCVDEMRKALGNQLFITPLMTRLQSLSLDERKQFSAFVQFLHSPDGDRLLTLNHQAMAVSDQSDANGMPQFTSDHDSKMEQIKTLLQSQPQPNQLPQALFGLGIYMQGTAEDFTKGGGMEEAQKKVFATASCTALQQQMEAYDKAHPQKK